MPLACLRRWRKLVSDIPVIDIPNDDTDRFELDRRNNLMSINTRTPLLSGNRDFDIPVVVMFNLKEEQKAYVFSTINGNQVKVNRSLIYDLFDLSESHSPYKTCH